MPHRIVLLLDAEIAAFDASDDAGTYSSPARAARLTLDGTAHRDSSALRISATDDAAVSSTLEGWRNYTCLIIDSDPSTAAAPARADPTVWHASFDEAVAAALVPRKPVDGVSASTPSPTCLPRITTPYAYPWRTQLSPPTTSL
jgi:hypothetical protein